MENTVFFGQDVNKEKRRKNGEKERKKKKGEEMNDILDKVPWVTAQVFMLVNKDVHHSLRVSGHPRS